MSEDKVLAFWMLVPKCSEICVVEIVGGPFAFDGHRPVSASSQDKIDFVPSLISPIVNLTVLRTSHNLVKYEVFPQRPEVVIAKSLPATVVADKSGIEAVDF